MLFLNSKNISDGQLDYLIKPGNYAGFMIRYSGVNQAGQTATLTNCGNIILNILGNDKINIDADFLNQANNLYYGAVEATSAAGGDFAFSQWIPSGAWFDRQNPFNLTAVQEPSFKLDFSTLTAAIVASGTVKIHTVLQGGRQSYWHTINAYNVVAGGAGEITNTIAKANIIELYLKNPTALIDRMQLTKDTTNFVNAYAADEMAYSNLFHNVETAVTLYAYEFAPNMQVNTAVSTNLTYLFNFTGAGTLNQIYSAIQYI